MYYAKNISELDFNAVTEIKELKKYHADTIDRKTSLIYEIEISQSVSPEILPSAYAQGLFLNLHRLKVWSIPQR
ncbi:Uncharacterized protein dnl_60350 [Desulfonema limicola]|uniref:Uncharacterized protein n=1 Tax=Desulfonema limicola TaxID=45656 RepID=A0A975GJM2_9BACT|nr:hypothetical protein [Desulfonema limicola]QTA83622.1 Uncharacterized protein dnl_60350 [Desulfonema limicola]